MRHLQHLDSSYDHAGPRRCGDGCPRCGWPDSEPYEVVSRHQTSDGLVVWTRCVCGALQLRLGQAVGAEPIARGRPRGGRGAA